MTIQHQQWIDEWMSRTQSNFFLYTCSISRQFMLTPLKNMNELQRRHSWTILNHCSDICLEKLKKPIKHTKTCSPAKIQASTTDAAGTADHRISAVPSQSPICRTNHPVCKGLPHIYISYIWNRYTCLNITAGTTVIRVPWPFAIFYAILFASAFRSHLFQKWWPKHL